MPNSQRGFVIPLVIAIVAILAIGGTIYLTTKEKVEAPVVIESNVPAQATTTIATGSEVKNQETYTNTKLGFEFQYPSILTLTENSEYVILGHSVPYRHTDFCDMKDGHINEVFVDYSSKIQVVNSDYMSAIKKIYPWNTRGFTDLNGDLSKGEIFTRKFPVNGQVIYEYFMGVEGCGIYTYIIPSELKTVVITNNLTPPFSFTPPYEGPFAKETIQEFRNLKGVIVPEQNRVILEGVLKSFKFIPTTPASNLMDLVLYIQDKDLVEKYSCSVTKKVVYSVPRTSAVADASLKILFAEELSSIGVYRSVSITNGVAKVLLESENTPGGQPIGSLTSCQSSHLFAVLKDTLTQYPTIKSVELYSPNGLIIF